MTDHCANAPLHPGGRPAAKVILEKYELGRLLGRGASAKVYHARHLPSGHSVAIKVLPKPHATSSDGGSTSILREITALSRLRHAHILCLHEVLASRSKVYLVLELAKGGELFSRLAAAGRLQEDHSRRLFRQLLSAVAFSHSRGVLHRDLKPENLLLDDVGDLKVSDFGLSAVVPSGASSDSLLRTVCGTPAYVAPEILSKKAYDGAKADVWSAGVILFVLHAGYLPFNDPNIVTMYRKMHRGAFRCPRWTSPELRRLLGRLLDPNPETRITVDDVLDDPWFKKGGFGADRWAAMMRPEGVNAKVGAGGRRGELNAFDIISLSSGLDLSGLFVAGVDRERFTSTVPMEELLNRVAGLGRREGLVVKRREKKAEFGDVALEGQYGNMMATVRFFRLTADVTMVEVEVEMGGVVRFWKDQLEPLLERDQ